MTTFSFHPVKHITTGEGGMITTNDENLYENIDVRLHSVFTDKKSEKKLATKRLTNGFFWFIMKSLNVFSIYYLERSKIYANYHHRKLRRNEQKSR